MQGLTEGRMVHYVPNEWESFRGHEHRAAVVVKVWRGHDGNPQENGCCQLQVFLDGTNDSYEGHSLLWKSSVHYDEDGKPGTWHWIEQA